MHGGGGLLEREVVTAAAAELVDRVCAGGAGALFLAGEAGLGKTSVIGQACQQAAEAGLTMGVGRGHPMETGLPFGVLIQALDGAGGRGLLGEDEADLGSAADWSARCYRVLRWLQCRAGSPVFLGIDDLHWADADSVALVSFLCRRMGSVAFGLIASLRPWPARASETVADLAHDGHGTVLALLPLSQQAAGALLQARLRRHVPAAIQRQAFELSAGNPLLLEQLAATIGKGADVPAADTGLTGSGQGMLLSSFAGLLAEGMRCAQAASVLGSGFLPEIAAQVAGLKDDEVDRAIEALARTGLIKQQPGAVAEFVHPLFRQALYDDLPGAVRSRLHARAFAALHARGLDAQAAEHAIPGGLAGDPEAIAVLAEAGRAARRKGAIATAVSWLEKAATLAGKRASERLLMDLAEAHLAGGDAERAIVIYRLLLLQSGLEPTVRIAARWMLARALATTGQHDLAAAAFAEAADRARDSDPATAVEVLLDAAYCAWLSTGAAAAMLLADQARDLASTTGVALRAQADADWAMYALMCGDPAGIAAAEAAAASCRADGNSPQSVAETARREGWGTANSLASCALGVEQLTVAERAFTVVRAAAEDADAPWAIAGLAVGHSYTLFRMGRLEEALAAITVAVSLAELVPLMDAYANVGMACFCLHMGRLDESARLCERVEAMATARGQLHAQLFLWDVVGHRRLREGAIAGACAAYDRLEDIRRRMGMTEPCLPAWPRHAMSAYLAGGRIQDAQRIITWLDEIVPRLPCRFPRIAAATGRAQLAELSGDRAAAEAYYRSALDLHGQTDLPVEQCETLLAYGGFLRRSGYAARARPVLAQAAEIGERTGAHWLAGFAREELKVAGGRMRRRAAPRTLTPQEERVAGLVATGATNANIAHQLCLSVSTVETHLERIYAKLGIHTRYQLIAMAARHQDQT
jgi:DNA-binding CsgD family transcriptional regulator